MDPNKVSVTSGIAENIPVAKKKLTNLFEFVREWDAKNTAITTQWKQTPWHLSFLELPRYPTIQSLLGAEDQDSDVVLRVIRPDETPCPSPPEAVLPWLLGGWKDPFREADHVASLNHRVEAGEKTIRFEDAAERPVAWDEWSLERLAWCTGDRTDERPCPPPPPNLEPWIKGEWRDPSREVEPEEELTLWVEAHTITEAFDGSDQRVAAWEQWTLARQQWCEAERPVRKAMGLYDRLFELRSRLRREGEAYRLLLGDGMVRGPGERGEVLHPILLQGAELRFDEQKACFTVLLVDEPAFLYTEGLATFVGVERGFLGELRDGVRSEGIEMRSGPDVRTFMHKALNTLLRGVRIADGPSPSEPDGKVVAWREPVLMLAPRRARIAEAVDKIIKRIETSPMPPATLLGIVSTIDETDAVTEPSHAGAPSGGRATRTVRRAPDPPAARGEVRRALLLAKEANEAQERILMQIEKQDTVVVQGPPGTGKTHTIANIMGHFLAKGQRVLVVSHASKALRVLRDSLPEPLRPLCVSLLDSDQESKNELEQSVRGIIHRVTTDDAHEAEREQAELQRRRDRLIDELAMAEDDLRDAVADEYRDVTVAGRSIAPIEAAKRLAAMPHDQRWIPGPLQPGRACPLTPQEVGQLYEANARVRPDHEEGLRGTLPRIDELPTPEQLGKDLARRDELKGRNLEPMKGLWKPDATANRDRLLEAWDGFVKAFKPVGEMRARAHLLECMDAGWRGGSQHDAWRSFVAMLREKGDRIDQCAGRAMKGAAQVPAELANEKGLETCREMRTAIGRSGTVHKYAFRAAARIRPGWKRFLEQATVAERPPQNEEHFAAIEDRILVAVYRDELRRHWRAHLHEHPDLHGADLGSKPEDTVRQHAARMEDAVRWYEDLGRAALDGLERAGLDLEAAKRKVEPKAGRFAEFEHLFEAAKTVMEVHTKRRLDALELAEIGSRLSDAVARLRRIGPEHDTSGVAGSMAEAIERGDADEYARAQEYLGELQEIASMARARAGLLDRLRPMAAGWARGVEEREPPHQGPKPPGDAMEAWFWVQVAQELDRRGAIDASTLQVRVATLKQDLRAITSELAESMAWQRQRARVGQTQRRALESWHAAVSARGYEKGVRSAQLKAQAQRSMREARHAVPAWVMTLNRAIETLDFDGEPFDVVIVDEASQANMMGLLPLAMARKAIVVGDDKQVTPAAVSEDLGDTQRLIEQYLHDFSERDHFTGRFSLYHIAKQSFQQHHMLKEHFRCDADIIAFSNTLSYDGQIEPIRDTTGNTIVPATVEHKVHGRNDRKVNREEAEEITALIVACMEQPEYAGATYGVISMLGDEQALDIDHLVRQHLPDDAYEKARLLCGSAAQFQGDERDVVFLSLVHSSGEGPLRLLRDDDAQKRYNVAASRARDQLWVVHSIDDHDLPNPEDLRKRLLGHVRDPGASSRQMERVQRKAESPFEIAIARELTERGYRIEAQRKVGARRIDLVAHGAHGRQVAIECDGEKYHTLENLDADLHRQGVLERLGWTFIRIRGSTFYREPRTTIAGLLERLREQGIEPIGPLDEDGMSHRGEELLGRVRARASELREQWRREAEGDTEDDEAGDGPRSILGKADGSRRPAPSTRRETHQPPEGTYTAIVDCLAQAGRPLSRSEIIGRTGIDSSHWNRVIGELLERRDIVRTGEKRGTRYSLPESDRVEPDGHARTNP